MADEKENPTSATASMPRVRRRAPTIELKATEVAVESPAAVTGETPPPPEPDNSVPPDYPTEPPAYDLSGAKPADEPPPSTPPEKPPRAFFAHPVAMAGLGSGLTALVILVALWLGGLFSEAESPDQRLASLEAQLREVASRMPRSQDNRAVDELNARLARLENASRQNAAAGATVSDDAVKQLQAGAADLARRADDNASAIREARGQAAAALTAAEAARRAAEGNNVEAVATRVTALERAVKALGESLNAAGTDKPLRAVVAAQALRAAVERGDAFAAELAAAKTLSPNEQAFAPLEVFAANGMPGAAALARELSALATAMTKPATTPTGGFLDRLQANAEKLVRIRPIDEAAGDEPNALVSRAQLRAERGDLAGAAVELGKLPPELRAPADDWIKKVETRQAAVNASRRLVADALAALGKSAP